MEKIDWQFALDLIIPGAEFGWLQPSEESKTDIYGKYEWIDWRDTRKKPSQKELETAWNDYVLVNGTPEEQEAQKENEKQEALDRLKLSASTEVSDLLKLIS